MVIYLVLRKPKNKPIVLQVETMVDGLPLYGFCRCQGSVKRGATSLAY